MGVIACKKGKPTRRTLLRAGLAWAVAPSLCRAGRSETAGPRPDRTLVLLHLSGGNDGLNTLIPCADPLYYELRPRLGRVARDVVAVNNRVGFHPSLSALVPLYERGSLAVVQGVGYPDPDYSHVGSCQIWATGTTETSCPRGWWDGVLRRLPNRSQHLAVWVGDEAPTVMATASPARVSVADGRGDTPNSGKNPAGYRPGQIEKTLATIARLVASPHPPSLVFAAMGGFDTHADQLEAHEEVLRKLGDGLAAFQRELEWRAVAERVVLMAWSEFGRRPAENATGGTDHGAAGPVLLLGKKIRGGLYGTMPSLEDTDFGNLTASVDFRTVYAVLAERWLGCSAGAAAGLRASLPIL